VSYGVRRLVTSKACSGLRDVRRRLHGSASQVRQAVQ